MTSLSSPSESGPRHLRMTRRSALLSGPARLMKNAASGAPPSSSTGMQVAAAPEAVIASRTGAGNLGVDDIGVGACRDGG